MKDESLTKKIYNAKKTKSNEYLLSDDRMRAFQITGQDAIDRGGITSFWHTNKFYAMIADPAIAETILKTCLEKDDIMEVAQLLTGNGSIFAKVSIWRPRRKILAPHFSVKNLSNFVKIFAKQSSVLVEQLKQTLDNGTFSVWNYFTTYTMDAVCETTLGVEVNAQVSPDQPFLNALAENLKLGTARFLQPWLQNITFYKMLPAYAMYMKTKYVIYNFIDEIIKLKRKEMIDIQKEKAECDRHVEEDGMKALLEMLIQNGGKNGFTALELQEELVVMVLAGTDTSAVAASFTALMLATHQNVQRKIYEELQEVFGDSNRPVAAEDIPRLKYLDAVVRETLRLYPPVPVITRKVENDVVLPSGHCLVRGCGIWVNIWAIHRNPQYWGDDADTFRPERFIETPLKHPAAFMPFSHGPRSCLGYKFAMMSVMTALASVIRRYRIMPASGQTDKNTPLRLKFDVMLKDVDNFRIQLESRVPMK